MGDIIKIQINKYVGSLMANSAIYLVANVVNGLVPLILLPVLTRYLTAREYGEVALFQTLISVLIALIGLNVAGAAARRNFDDSICQGSGMSDYIGACFIVIVSISVVVLIICAVCAEQIQEIFSLSVEWIFLACLCAALTVVSDIRMGQWQIERRAVIYGAFQVSRSAVNMLLSIVLVILCSLGSSGRIFSQSLAFGVFAIIAMASLIKDGLLRVSWQPRNIRDVLAFGVPLLPHSVGAILLTQVDRIFINSNLGLIEAATYTVAAQISSGLTLLFVSFNAAYVPWLFERLVNNSKDEMKKIVRLTYWYFVGALAIAAGLAAIGPKLVIWVAGDKYAEAGGVIGWLALAQAFGGMYLMVTNYIFFSKRTGLLSVVTIASGLVNVGLLFLFVPFGIRGAAIASCSSMLMRFLLTWGVAQISHPMPWFGGDLIAKR